MSVGLTNVGSLISPLSTGLTDVSSSTGQEESGLDTSGSQVVTSNLSLNPSVTPAAPVTIAPTGGQMETAQQSGIYTPARPDYLKYSQSSEYGVNDIQKLYKSLYGNSTDPDRLTRTGMDLDNEPVQNYSAQVDKNNNVTANPEDKATTTTTTTTGDGNTYSGYATTFGLDPRATVNADGTVDAKWYDSMDQDKSAFGYNSRDPKLIGASLPIDVIKNSIGDYTKDASILSAIKRGDYKVAVTNGQGVTKVMNIVDAGPAKWTGNMVDLTYGATKALGFTGKDKASIQLIGPNGHTISIKGYHPSTVTNQEGGGTTDTSAKVPSYQHITGKLTFGDQTYTFGSGGFKGARHIPYGDYPITPDTIGPWGEAHGALGINYNDIYEKETGKHRQGIELHAGSTPELITEGCIAFSKDEYTALKAQILKATKSGKQLRLHVGPGGATITEGTNTKADQANAKPPVQPTPEAEAQVAQALQAHKASEEEAYA